MIEKFVDILVIGSGVAGIRAALASASLERKESIGYFIRSDFPEKSRSSKNHHICLKGDNSIVVD